MKTKQTFWFRRLAYGLWANLISIHGTEAQARAGRGLKTFCPRTFVQKTGLKISKDEIVEVEITFDVKKRLPMRR